ncbi:MAG: gluconokinase, GntK/IdnK-type [Pseudomonadota bacterium]
MVHRLHKSAPIMLMGVMTAGKTEIGSALAARLDGRFIEGDAHHPAENIAKMQAGQALSDADRGPWLKALAKAVISAAEIRQRIIFSCSALKVVYRAKMRDALPGLITLCLRIDPKVAADRARHRPDHFMPAALIKSQFNAMQWPDHEPRTQIIDANLPIQQVLDAAVDAVQVLDETQP